ncbi:tRNA (adenine(22)-N(1))-methyltransferase TrmK [Psychromonas arctica]|uniref:tRNA (Adenine(22)-N(1))-methyltransferase TrmK n=1 Tax=Psychromonas arctica TaxID=168275 RepID=A0ABU9H7J6_9GAMM
MKINKRLLSLSEMVDDHYDLVWDCCCDHGLLGIKILTNNVIKEVNFVDVVPDIINQLHDKLTTYGHHLPMDAKWQTRCEDVAQLPLFDRYKSNQLQANQLVIISGVGGELMVEMLTRLMSRYAGLNIDFLLCPVHHTYKLRRTLIELNFKLKQEQLVIENKRGYELMLINQGQGGELTLTGDQLWQPLDEHQQYLAKLITHYQRIVSANGDAEPLVQSALSDYQALYHKLF